MKAKVRTLIFRYKCKKHNITCRTMIIDGHELIYDCGLCRAGNRSNSRYVMLMFGVMCFIGVGVAVIAIEVLKFINT